MKTIKRTIVGEGISKLFGGFPKDLEIGKQYELKWDFELRQYMVLDKYKAMSFKWDKNLPQ
jgi:hypothetical protein